MGSMPEEEEPLPVGRVVRLAFVDVHDIVDKTEGLLEELSAARESLAAAAEQARAAAEAIEGRERYLRQYLTTLRRQDVRLSTLTEVLGP